MAKEMRMSSVARKLNIALNTVAEALNVKPVSADKISQEQFEFLKKKFSKSLGESDIQSDNKEPNIVIEESTEFLETRDSPEIFEAPESLEKLPFEKTTVDIDNDDIDKVESDDNLKDKSNVLIETEKLPGLEVLGNLTPKTKSATPIKKDLQENDDITKIKAKQIKETQKKNTQKLPVDIIEAKADVKGITLLGKMSVEDLQKKQPIASSDATQEKKKRPRRRINENRTVGKKSNNKKNKKEELSEKEIHEQIKATLKKFTSEKSNKKNRAKFRKEKRQNIAEATKERELKLEEEQKTLQVSEFISASDLASLMSVDVNEVISVCMNFGMFVSINQRLDAESITVIADEFGFEVSFISKEDDLLVEIEEDKTEDLVERAPIITIMGHVDHGKTSLLDYIRHADVVSEEAGGITQHIGAYDLETKSGKRVAFLDTPGHEAFTAMRARGAKVTDIVIIVIAADDAVMPQTKEAINHAQVARVPIIIAINKVDKDGANPEKIKEQLSNENVLVEDWGGKYQCQEISAKTGKGVDELLEKVLLEAEILELVANPNKPAIGTVIESELDKGRGYVTTVLVQEGTLNVGDIILAGAVSGKVKALFNHRGNSISSVKPSTPAQILGFNGAPQAGDILNVLSTDKEAREIASKREQIHREHSVRTRKHITLDEIGRRLAVGSFKELNIIVKADVDGSVEALTGSLLKLSTEEVQVNIIQSSVGQISESDVLLASASDSIIVGFQVRPSFAAKKLAESEEIEIRLYSIIYQVIEEIKDAMEGMLAPTVEEYITGNAEVREVYKISKIGTVAGCYVSDGVLKRNNKIRIIRDGVVIYMGDIGQLKRFKEDVTEVKVDYECGISVKGFNDIQEKDIIEGFAEREIKRTL